MEDFIGIAFMIGIAVLVVGGIIWSIFAEKKRKKDLEETAGELGLSFYPDGEQNLLSRLQSFNLFNQGRSRKMKNLIMGDSGEVSIAIFDYQYTTGSGKHSQTHLATLASIQSSELVCPAFTMRPEGMFDKIGGVMGFQDIDFDSHPTFSKMFVLKSPNEEATRAYFSAPLLEFFESKKGVSVEAEPGMMFFYRTRSRVKPDELKDLLSQAYEVFGHMVDTDA